MTYKQAYDKITEVYISGKIKPYNVDFCFCGTLSGGFESWHTMARHSQGEMCGSKLSPRTIARHFYTGVEYYLMENALLSTIKNMLFPDDPCELCSYAAISLALPHPNYEEALFRGMCAALEVLKQIHISRGENVDEIPFVKRELVNA